eukprot:GGOE01019811.1.p1 GENE.GGOE01019811.1~~GGOE01019811.1.p1  ORF type:complete len:509 (+),score=143.69 GGOE01019811.1:48-1529(+)
MSAVTATSSSATANSDEPKLTEDGQERLRRLQLLLDAGVLSQEDFDTRKAKLEEEFQVTVSQIPTAAEQLGAAPHIPAHLTEETSPAVRINAVALLNEYFQHIKEGVPETMVRVIPPEGMRPPLVLCTISCKAGGLVLSESLIGPNKKLVRNEIALSLLQQLLPDLTPEDIMHNIKGMSSGVRQPPRRTASQALLVRKVPATFHPGPGCIQTSLGKLGAPLPVVCGDADDISRVLQSYCEVKEVMMPNLVTRGLNAQKQLVGTMQLTVKDQVFSVEVQKPDLASVRQEACLQMLRQIFPLVQTPSVLRAEVEKLMTEEQKKKRQKTEGLPQQFNVPPTSLAATLLSYYCQLKKVPMPDLDRENKLTLALPDGTTYTVDAGRTNKKVARAEACLRMIKQIFPGKELNEVHEAIQELRKSAKEAAKVSKPPPPVGATRRHLPGRGRGRGLRGLAMVAPPFLPVPVQPAMHWSQYLEPVYYIPEGAALYFQPGVPY